MKYLICALSVAPFPLSVGMFYFESLRKTAPHWAIDLTAFWFALLFVFSFCGLAFFLLEGKAQKAWKEVLGYE